MFRKLLIVISEWKAKTIYLSWTLIRFVFMPGLMFLIAIPRVLSAGSTQDDLLTFFYMLIIALIAYFLMSLIYLSVQFLLYEKLNMKKHLEIINYLYKKGTWVNKSSLELVNYYQGKFEKEMSLMSSLNQNQSKNLLFKFSAFCNLYKSSIMTGNEKLIEKSRSELEKIHFKNAKREKWRVNELAFCDMMYDIVILKQVNEEIDNWAPQYPGGKINILERTYFQALNDQLKGEADQAQEYIEQLSKENENLYFVKEAKKYMEERE